jgi:hypothetical protein
MRTKGNERVSVRQGYGYGCRYGTLNEANLLKTTRTCCSLEAWSAYFRPFVHDLNTSSPNRQVRSSSGRDFSPLRHSPSCSGRPVWGAWWPTQLTGTNGLTWLPNHEVEYSLFFFNFVLGRNRTLDPRVPEPKRTPLGYILIITIVPTATFAFCVLWRALNNFWIY